MTRFVLVAAALAFAPALVRAADPKSFPEAKSGKGELKYLDGVPVLTLRGKPAEMGEQFGVLAVKNAPDLHGLHDRFLKDTGQESKYPLVAKMAGWLKPAFPPHVLTEME